MPVRIFLHELLGKLSRLISPVNIKSSTNMDSDMGKAFDADFPLGPYPYTHISNQRPALDLSQSSLPSSLPQVQINQYAGAVREQPYSNLPLRPGLHIATSATAPNHGPRRSSASPVYHTARYSPYERPLSSHQTSPTHRATQSFTASSVSPKREHKSAMRSRQEGENANTSSPLF